MKGELFLLLSQNLILIFSFMIKKIQIGDLNENFILIVDAFPPKS